jgi:hypothetical protein
VPFPPILYSVVRDDAIEGQSIKEVHDWFKYPGAYTKALEGSINELTGRVNQPKGIAIYRKAHFATLIDASYDTSHRHAKSTPVSTPSWSW